MNASGSDPKSTERKFTGPVKAHRRGRQNRKVDCVGESRVYSRGDGRSRAPWKHGVHGLAFTRADENAIMCDTASTSPKILTHGHERNVSWNGKRKFALGTWSWWAFFCMHIHVLRAVAQGKSALYLCFKSDILHS